MHASLCVMQLISCLVGLDRIDKHDTLVTLLVWGGCISVCMSHVPQARLVASVFYMCVGKYTNTGATILFAFRWGFRHDTAITLFSSAYQGVE